MAKILMKNGRVATAEQVFEGDILINGEVIAEIGEAGALAAGDATVVDASGKYVLPGGVDPHTHFDLDVGFTRASDDFYTGGVAAAFGGTTTVIDHMAFGPAGCALSHQAGVYHKLAEPCIIDYGLHGVFQHVNANVLRDMVALKKDGITSFKVYMTYDFKLDDADFLRVLRRAKELGLTICVHCENHEVVNMLRADFVAAGQKTAAYHPLSRPPEAEAEAVFRALMLARLADEARIYIVHLTTALGLETIRFARNLGQQNIFAETCPQYLFLDEGRYDDPAEGLKYIMSPPLRKAADEEALWQGLKRGDVDTVGTDHCPFFFETQKQRGKDDFTQCPNGAPGVELRLPLLFSEGFLKGKLPLADVVKTCCAAPAEIFGLSGKKGNIAIGYDADLAIFDPEAKWTVTKAALHENVDYTPYEGMALQGRVAQVLSRGEVIVENGRLLAEKGRGRYLARK